MSLEDKFHQAVEEWRKHCRKNSIYSMPQAYLDCDAYRRIVAMGQQVIPLIREQLHSEYEIAMKYKDELRKLYKKLNFMELKARDVVFNIGDLGREFFI